MERERTVREKGKSSSRSSNDLSSSKRARIEASHSTAALDADDPVDDDGDDEDDSDDRYDCIFCSQSHLFKLPFGFYDINLKKRTIKDFDDSSLNCFFFVRKKLEQP